MKLKLRFLSFALAVLTLCAALSACSTPAEPEGETPSESEASESESISGEPALPESMENETGKLSKQTKLQESLQAFYDSDIYCEGFDPDYIDFISDDYTLYHESRIFYIRDLEGEIKSLGPEINALLLLVDPHDVYWDSGENCIVFPLDGSYVDYRTFPSKLYYYPKDGHYEISNCPINAHSAYYIVGNMLHVNCTVDLLEKTENSFSFGYSPLPEEEKRELDQYFPGIEYFYSADEHKAVFYFSSCSKQALPVLSEFKNLPGVSDFSYEEFTHATKFYDSTEYTNGIKISFKIDEKYSLYSVLTYSNPYPVDKNDTIKFWVEKAIS